MKLVVEESGRKMTLEMDRPEVLIGRGGDCDVVLRDAAAGETHCRIFLQGGRWKIGGGETLLNGKAVEEADLKAGDRIQIGEAVITCYPPETPLVLKGTEGTVKGQTFPIGPEPLTFGRHKKNKVVLTDPGVSNYHAILTKDAEGITITDLQSTNGTRVNGKKVDRCVLEPGDKVSFMGAVFTLGDGEEKEEEAPAPPPPVKEPPPPPKKKARKAEKTEKARPAAVPAEDVIEFDYDLLLEETSRSSLAQTIGLVVVSLLIVVFGGLLLRGIFRSPSPDPGIATNLLENGSLEGEGGWIIPDGGAIDAEEAKGGERSLRLDPGGEEIVCVADQVVRTLAGTGPLQVRAQVKVAGPAMAGVRLRWLSDQDGEFQEESMAPIVPGPSDWTEVRGTFAPPEKATRVRLECFAWGSSGSAWFDRIQLTQKDRLSLPLRITAKRGGMRLRLDEKGIGALSRDGVLLVEGMEIRSGEGPYDRSGASRWVALREGEALVFEGGIYESTSGRWHDYRLETAANPDGIGLTCTSAEGDRAPPVILAMTVRTGTVGGPLRIASPGEDPRSLSWDVSAETCQELIIGSGRRLLSFTFQFPVQVSSAREGRDARVTIVSQALLGSQIQPVSPTMAAAADRLLGQARQLAESGPWGEAFGVIEKLRGDFTDLGQVVKEAQVLGDGILRRTADRVGEIRSLLDQARTMKAPALLEVARTRMDELDRMWQGGAGAAEVADLRKEAAALEAEQAVERSEREAARLYGEGRSHMEAERFRLAEQIYRYIQDRYPDASILEKVSIDLAQIEKMRSS